MPTVTHIIDQNLSGAKSFGNSLVLSDNLLYLSQASGQISGTGFTGFYDGGHFLGDTKITQNNMRLQNVGNTWAARDSNRDWRSVAMSSDGKYQTAVGFGLQIYVSNDYGTTWAARGSSTILGLSVAMSSDGKYQTAVSNPGQIYVSNNYGTTWVARDSTRGWLSVAMSSDGKYQTAVVNAGQIYVSNDYGTTWVARDSIRDWRSVAMSSDGKYQTAVVNAGQIYVSNDYGTTWVARDSNRDWRSVAMSSDGKYQTAVGFGLQIYVSNDYGTTWAARGSSTILGLSVAMSSDGKYQTAVSNPGQIYVSNNYGTTWVARDSTRGWLSVAMSSDGKYQTAVVNAGQIYVSVADEIINGSFTADNIYGNNLVYTTGNQTISGVKTFATHPTVNGTGVLLRGEASVNSTLPKDTGPYARMPFGIRGNNGFSQTDLTTGKASIVPFYTNNQITGYKAVSNRIGNLSDGPWTVRVALYDINNGISSPIFLESSNIQINAEAFPLQQRIANFTGNGKDLNIGWYANVSWLVSGNGAIFNGSNFTWPNRSVIGSRTGLNVELPANFSETYYFITGLSGNFYRTGAPPNIGTIMTTDIAGTNTPWFFPFY